MNCHELESNLLEYFEGGLSEEKTEALLSHLEGCEACLAEFQAYQEQEDRLRGYFQIQRERAEKIDASKVALPELEAFGIPRRGRGLVWAAAAMILLASGVGGWRLYRDSAPIRGARMATIHAIEGRVQVLRDGVYQPAKTGAGLYSSERIKVAGGGYLALALPDGAIIEAREGTQLCLEAFADRTELELNRGHIWAHLNQPLEKRFVVETPHLKASVDGAVYGVSEGLDRSVVEVAQGTAVVEAGGAKTQIGVAQAYSSREWGLIEPSPNSTLWSHYPENLAALAPKDDSYFEFAAQPIGGASAALTVADSVAPDGEISDLLDLMPLDTRMFVNLGDWPGAVAQFKDTAYSALGSEGFIQKAWEALRVLGALDEMIEEAHLAEILSIGEFLDGQFAVGVDAEGRFLLAADCDWGQEAARAIIEGIVAEDEQGLVALDAGGANWDEPGRLNDFLYISKGRLIASSDADLAKETNRRVLEGQASGFRDGDFFQELMSNIESPNLMVGLDLDRLIPERSTLWSDRDAAQFDLYGIGELDYLLVSPSFIGRGMNHAARLGFSDSRSGAMNWLAEPRPMRAMDFFSPDVHFFASAILRSPREVFYDLLQSWGAGNDTEQYASGIDFFAQHEPWFESFGGEVALALESPILPVPNIKIAIEVLDAVAFEAHLDQLIEVFAALANLGGERILRTQATHQNRIIHTLQISNLPILPSYAIVDDYFIAGPGPQFVADSIDVYQSNFSIAFDTRFHSLLPVDAEANVSLLVYQDIAKVVPKLVRTKLAPELTESTRELMPDIDFMERYRAPGVLYATAWSMGIDLHLNAPSGVDLNLGLAVPLVANWLGPYAGRAFVASKVEEARANLQLLATEVENFQWAHLRLPLNLKELDLWPGLGLERIPSDPFASGAGGLLRLAPGPGQDQATIYSVGPDGVDDGGALEFDPALGPDAPGDIVVRLQKKVEN